MVGRLGRLGRSIRHLIDQLTALQKRRVSVAVSDQLLRRLARVLLFDSQAELERDPIDDRTLV
ncbi:hypothetical protein [Brevibacterium yomogidense]|uniref:hypothetical protein n=1 Tax=Brevibacterium yomogidense TaxID=946573 RepID=UPI0018DF5286